MGATGKKMSSFLLTKFTGSYFYIFKNNIIKMWEKFIILEFAWIILLILIGQIFLIQNDANSLGRIFLSSLYIDPWVLAAIIPIKTYSNAEQDKSTILADNKDKSGIYMWTNNINKKKIYRLFSKFKNKII